MRVILYLSFSTVHLRTGSKHEYVRRNFSFFFCFFLSSGRGAPFASIVEDLDPIRVDNEKLLECSNGVSKK